MKLSIRIKQRPLASLLPDLRQQIQVPVARVSLVSILSYTLSDGDDEIALATAFD